MRRDQPRPFAMEYSRQGQCLVALYENEQADEAAWSSRVTVLDLAGGGRILCRLGDWMCALQTLPPAHGKSCSVTLHASSWVRDSRPPTRCTCAGVASLPWPAHCWREALATRR